MKAIFLTNSVDFESPIPGGVQICSKEFYDIIKIRFELIFFNIHITRKITYRLIRKLGIDFYHLYDVNEYKNRLIAVLKDNEVKCVFINKAEAIKFAPLIKSIRNDIKVIVLSHGNESGDFLGDISRGFYKFSTLKLLIKKIRLGLNIYVESYYRIRYVDVVLTMSETEKHIEYWLGSKEVILIPRVYYPEFLNFKFKEKKFGYVGTLDHTPNISALISLFEEIEKANITPEFVIEIVGSPVNKGEQLTKRFTFVKYLGAKTDTELKEIASEWSFFINPIFWYSRGASMKLRTAINWGIPIISTNAGARGYEWRKGSMILCLESPKAMAKIILDKNIFEQVEFWANQTKLIAENGIPLSELSDKLNVALDIDIPK